MKDKPMENSRPQKYLAQLMKCGKVQCPALIKKPCWLRGGEKLSNGLDIHGFFFSEIGLGHSARLYYTAAVSQKMNVNAINRQLPGRQSEKQFETIVSNNGIHKYGLSIDGLRGFSRLGREICRKRYNIALPLWELEKIPKRRIRNLAHFDILWAPSSFIKENLERATGRSVQIIKHPIQIYDQKAFDKNFSGPLRILFFFDFDSFPARKNPEAAVKAFKMAFYSGEDVLLTIKTRGSADAGRRSWLSEQVLSDSRIRIIDETISSEAVSKLMRDHDVFLSLHRSEGFGLGCAEALAVGNIVISTDYGGTKDFISEETGFPVEWKRVSISEGEYVEAKGGTWADPSIEHAAHRLREVYDAPKLAWKRALSGNEKLRQNHSIEVVGQRMREALEAYGMVG